MRTKGAVSSVPISLSLLNRVLKPNAKIMVSKKFADSIKSLDSSGEASVIEAALKATMDTQEDDAPISVESY